MKLFRWKQKGGLPQSPPPRGRGLKPQLVNGCGGTGIVAPSTGAWIETAVSCLSDILCKVAPSTGAWIETWPQAKKEPGAVWSPPPRGRGLKQHMELGDAIRLRVAPSTGAWIETHKEYAGKQSPGVAPSTGAWIETSRWISSLTLAKVAPSTGAWIETHQAGFSWCGVHVAPSTGAWIETP